MSFEKTPPIWNNAGQEPSLELQENGFTAGYKPPAPYFNYLFHQNTECLKELQEKVAEKENVNAEFAKRNITTYTLLHQIGITIGTETIQSLAQKIPMNSILTYSVSANYKDDTYPDYGVQDRNGVMEVIRGASSNVFFRFTRSANTDKDARMWVGNWGSTTGWSGWKELAYVTNGTLTSDNADFAEVGEWSDGNPDSEDRLGYFVSVSKTESGITMTKATADSDVRGVTIASPAFAANASRDKYGEDGNLLKQYNYVAFAGFATVIDNGTCEVNSRCMPDNNGCAVPSTNFMGYQVIERIDDTHILILVEPNADMLNRIKDDIDALVENKADSDHTHKYAGSSSAGGAATSANKLNTNAGSATKPIYFDNGVPKACTYELNKTVPSDAVFTDTIAVKSVEDTSIQLADAMDANMLLDHAPVNMLNIICTSKTVNGLTVTVNPDKTIYVKGTATGTTYVDVGNFNVTNGQTFSYSSIDDDNWNKIMFIKGYDGTNSWRGKGVYTATVTKTIYVQLYVANGTTVDCTYYPRVYYENKQYAYVPPSGYEVTACGKNLVDVSEISTWDTLNNSDSCQKMLKVKPNTKYTISQLSNNGSYSWLFAISGRHTNYSANWMSVSINGCLVDKPYTVTSDSEGWITIGSFKNITSDIQIQLEEGDTATTYEPFNGKKVSVDRNTSFPLAGLESYSDLTNIYNSYGATMEVAYANNSAGKAILDGLCNNSEIIHNNSEIIDNSMPDKWDSTKTYYAGDYCIENNQLWKCKGMNTGASPSGSIGSTYWDKVTIASELNSKANTGYKKLLTIPKGSIDYQASTTYTLSTGKLSDYSSILLVDHNNSYSTVPLPIFENGSKVNVGTGDVEVKYSSDIKIVVSISGESAGNYGLTVYGL